MIQFFARVVELREEKYVKYDGKITTVSPPREFLEVTLLQARQAQKGNERVSLPKVKRLTGHPHMKA